MPEPENANILFAAQPEDWLSYREPLTRALREAGGAFDLRSEFPPDQVDYIVYAPSSAVQDFTPYTRLKAVLNLWAGVENVVGNETLTVPLARMVDPGMTRGMCEWVAGHVLRHHLGMDAHITGQDGRWHKAIPPLASDRRVTILGLGELGRACAAALHGFGFPVAGWRRSPKSLPDIETFHGPAGLNAALSRADILVLLLPDTPATENLIDAAALARMPQGAFLINPGRGTLIVDADLIDALDTCHLAHATLDVFRAEPLSPTHPFWAHPKVTVTPHIASETRVDSASRVIAENVRRGQAGEPFLHLVDRSRGY